MSYTKKTELVGRTKECIPLTISDQFYFLRLSKVSSMSHHGSVDRIQYKECYFMLSYSLIAFFIVHFYHFHLFI